MFDSGYLSIPPGLDDMEPGIGLAALAGGIDVNRVSPFDRIVVLRVRQRLASHFQAQVYESMASVVEAMEHDPDEENWAEEAAAAEIRVALGLTRTAADAELRSPWSWRGASPKYGKPWRGARSTPAGPESWLTARCISPSPSPAR
jgi:hypothetical protein